MKGNYGGGIPVVGWKKAVFGLAIGLLAIMVMTGSFAWFVDREMMGREHMSLASAVVLALSGLLGGLCCGRGEGRLGRCVIVGAGLILMLLLLNLLLFDGHLSGLLPGSLVIFGSVAASMLIGGQKRSRSRRSYSYKKYRNR